jgi:hypothetical protein
MNSRLSAHVIATAIVWVGLAHAGGHNRTGRPADGTHFPLEVAENERYLVDARGAPALIVGDTAWSLIAQLDEPDIQRYLDDRARRGFNAIIVSLIEHKFASRAPATRAGVSPFLAPGDFAHPNPEYFDFAHRVIEQALRRGIGVWLCPAYLGWNGGDQGFYSEIKAAGPEALRAYGRYVGSRFKDLPNIVWIIGGDYALPPAERWAGAVLAEGIREAGARQLITAHGGQTTARDTFGEPDWLAIDTVYRYDESILGPLLQAYERKPTRPYVLIESIYEGEHDAPPDRIRRQAWWSMLSGACGQFFGNNPIWHFDGPGLFPANATWTEALNGTGSRDMARLGTFFRAWPWHRLEPERADELVISGRGAGPTTLTAASTADDRLAVVYIPSGAAGTRGLTVDLGRLAGPVKAFWFNPARDADVVVIASDLPASGRKEFETPGDNVTGASDWVLVLESR